MEVNSSDATPSIDVFQEYQEIYRKFKSCDFSYQDILSSVNDLAKKVINESKLGIDYRTSTSCKALKNSIYLKFAKLQNFQKKRFLHIGLLA